MSKRRTLIKMLVGGISLIGLGKFINQEAKAQINGVIETKLEVFPTTGRARSSVTVTGRLTTYFGNQPVPGALVDAYIVYNRSQAFIGRYPTDNNGYVRVQINSLPAGTNYVGLYFKGNYTHSAPIYIATVTMR